MASLSSASQPLCPKGLWGCFFPSAPVGFLPGALCFLSIFLSLLSLSSTEDVEAGNWELLRTPFYSPAACSARPCPLQPAHNRCGTMPWAGLMRSGKTLAGGGQSGLSVLGRADGWSPDSNRRMRTCWRRSRPEAPLFGQPRSPSLAPPPSSQAFSDLWV